jgi:hypothetical protein
VNDDPAANDDLIGSPVPDVFPPDDPAARFVVAMSMARNDIDRAFHDLFRSKAEDRQDITYRIRLITGHFVEATDALAFYREKCPEVRALLERVSDEGKKDLKLVSGTLQEAGDGALQDVRNNTFHYPSPNPKYGQTTSDDKLRRVLAQMTDQGVSYHFDGDTRTTTMSFADEAALELAMGRPTITADEALRRSDVARKAAFAFRRWVNALIEAYIEANKLIVGDAIVTAKNKPAPPT